MFKILPEAIWARTISPFLIECFFEGKGSIFSLYFEPLSNSWSTSFSDFNLTSAKNCFLSILTFFIIFIKIQILLISLASTNRMSPKLKSILLLLNGISIWLVLSKISPIAKPSASKLTTVIDKILVPLDVTKLLIFIFNILKNYH